MKVYFASALAGALLFPNAVVPTEAQTTGLLENARTIPWSQVPGPVRQSMQSYSGKNAVVGVQRGTINGQVVYGAALDRDGQTVQIFTMADGTWISPMNTVAWNELPSAVQESYSTLNTRDSIEEITAEEQPAYTVYNFSVNNGGSRYRLELAEDGGIVGYNERSRNTAQASPPAGSVINESAGAERNAGALRRQGVVRIEQIPFGNLSQAAQQTISTVTGGAAIRSIEPENVNGILCYEVKYDAAGQMAAVCVSSDGQVIK